MADDRPHRFTPAGAYLSESEIRRQMITEFRRKARADWWGDAIAGGILMLIVLAMVCLAYHAEIWR